MELIDTQEQLRDHYGVLHPLAVRKVHARLDDFCRRFIALSPFVVVASFDAEGRADASPRGDAPGFVRIVDDVTLLIPDRPGNNRVDSFGNIVSTGRVGLLFLVPGINDALRVNGGARVTTDNSFLQLDSVAGKLPRGGLLVSVEEAFFHCGKAVMRSQLWATGSQVPKNSFPGIGRIISEQLKEGDPAELERAVEEESKKTLY
jgi:PPOX class probable FMN-dependent enzyme